MPIFFRISRFPFIDRVVGEIFDMDRLEYCLDLHGRKIAQGMHFVPGPDTCTLCICDNGSPKWCKAVLCSPPQDCKSFRVGNSCCEFICLDDTLGKGDNDHEFNADLGLRLIATAITAILSLSLLFFLIHRLRQRKIRAIVVGRQSRELCDEERTSIGYITGPLGYDAHYDEAAPPQLHGGWKPGYYSRAEAPPPYEEAVAAGHDAPPLATINPGPSILMHGQQHRTIPVNLATSCALPLVAPIPSVQNPSIHPPPVLHPPAEEVDDYRSECENCQAAAEGERDGPGEDLVTMTLHRRTNDAIHPPHFYRASLTLPTQVGKHRNAVSNGVTMSCARENWFSSMPESSSSEEDE